MAHTCYRQKRVKVGIPISQSRVWVQSLKKGDRVVMPPGCTVTDEPERLPDDLFHRYEFMPTNFKRLPFAFSEKDHPKEEDIQKILHFSLKQQKEEDVAYSSGFVSTVVKSCLNAIDVPCSLEMGFRKIDKDQNPHVWLNINNIIVDNSYEKYTTLQQISCLERSTPKCYQKNTFSYPRQDKMPADKDDFAVICNKKGLEIFLKEPDKGIALGLNQEPLYLYYFSMVRFMMDAFGVHIRCFNPSVRHYCWGCGLFPAHSRELLTDILPNGYAEVEEDSSEKIQKFKHCNQCMISNYCSILCQEKDWDDQHRFLCVSRVAGPASDY